MRNRFILRAHSRVIRYLSKVSLFFLLFLSTLVFANSDKNDNTVLTIKLYAESLKRVKHFSYRIMLPKEEYYSFYLGSDLPSFRVVHKNIIQGRFRSAELVNIRVHSRNSQQSIKSESEKKASISIFNSENSRLIWQGSFDYGRKKHTVTVQAKENNHKDYNVVLRVEQDNTVWIEIIDR